MVQLAVAQRQFGKAQLTGGFNELIPSLGASLDEPKYSVPWEGSKGWEESRCFFLADVTKKSPEVRLAVDCSYRVWPLKKRQLAYTRHLRHV